MKLTLKENGLFAGQLPLLPATHDSTGRPASASSLSGDWINTVLDVTGVPENQMTVLAAQYLGDRARSTSLVFRGKARSLRIDENGLVFCDDAKNVADGGPFLNVALPRGKVGERKQIDVGTLNAHATQGEGTACLVSRGGFGLIISGVADRRPMTLQLTDKQSGAKWEYTLFPYIRGSTRNVVACWINDVPVGELRAKPSTKPK